MTGEQVEAFLVAILEHPHAAPQIASWAGVPGNWEMLGDGDGKDTTESVDASGHEHQADGKFGSGGGGGGAKATASDDHTEAVQAKAEASKPFRKALKTAAMAVANVATKYGAILAVHAEDIFITANDAGKITFTGAGYGADAVRDATGVSANDMALIASHVLSRGLRLVKKQLGLEADVEGDPTDVVLALLQSLNNAFGGGFTLPSREKIASMMDASKKPATESWEAPLLESGFTGTVTDKIGRVYHYQDGRRVAQHHETPAAKHEAHAKARAARATAVDVLKVATTTPEKLTGDHLRSLASHLAQHSTAELKALKKQFGLVGGKLKDDLVAKVAAHFAATLRADTAPAAEPAQENPTTPVDTPATPAYTPVVKPEASDQPKQEPTMTTELPKLTGSEKQVAWATENRSKALDVSKMLPADRAIGEVLMPVIGSAAARLPASASWWIDTKGRAPFKEMFKLHFGLDNSKAIDTGMGIHNPADSAYEVIESMIRGNRLASRGIAPTNIIDHEDDVRSMVKGCGSRAKAVEVAAAFGFQLGEGN